MPIYLGVEIGGTKLQVVTGDADGQIADRRRFTVNPQAGPAGIQSQIETGVRELRQKNAAEKIGGIGVGFGGPVDRRGGRIAKSHQVEGWSGFPLAEWLAQIAEAPVAMENDSNLATLAEALRGAGVGCSPVFYFNLGSGVGGGIVVDGKLLHGRPPGEGEFGHLRLDRAGTIVEQRCSGWAIDRRLRGLATQNPDCALARLLGAQPGGEGRHLRAAIEAGDPGATQVLRELAADLGFALSHVVHLIHPEVIVMGGGLSLVGEPLRQAVAHGLEPYLMEVFRPGPPIRLATLGEDAVPVGALILASTLRQ